MYPNLISRFLLCFFRLIFFYSINFPFHILCEEWETIDLFVKDNYIILINNHGKKRAHYINFLDPNS